METKTEAYLYKWTHLPTGKWYIGSRSAKGCKPSDGYICSSTTVKPMILDSSAEWQREILAIGEPQYIVDLETRYLKLLDAANDPVSFNLHNGDGKFTTVGRIEPEDQKIKRIQKLTGKPKPDGFGDIVRKNRTGMKFNSEWRKNIGIASTGRIQDAEARKKNSEKNSGENNAAFTGYCISPCGKKFDSSIKAALFVGVSRSTIMRWSKTNKNGWSFIPKEDKQ